MLGAAFHLSIIFNRGFWRASVNFKDKWEENKNWIYALVGAFALFYIAGWNWINVKMSVYAFNKFISGFLILDSIAIYKQGFGILISNKLYGFEFTDRFFYSPIISWLFFGGAVGLLGIVIDEMTDEENDTEEEENNEQK